MNTITANDTHMIDLARKVSYKSQYDKYKIGAVICNKSKILGIGFNRHKTHPKAPNKYKFLHAEIDACLGVNEGQLDKSTIYVFRARKDGTMGLAKPCSTCHGFLSSVGVKTMVYTTNDGIKKERV